MKSRQWFSFFLGLAFVVCWMLTDSRAQSPSVLYTWDNSGNAEPNIEAWIRSFGAANTAATLDNALSGVLRITENGTAVGGSQAFSDGFNRVREAPTGPNGGLDLTGLSSLQFDVGHNGSAPVNVQFYVQASTVSTFVALGSDVAVAPGVSTYNLPLTGLLASQAVYVRTIGMNIRDHAALGNLTWTLEEVRSAGTPLTTRDLATFDVGTAEGGLQGAIVNFDNASIAGNNSGQNQTGLSHNSSGSGSLQWTDVAGGNGGAISLGNGTAWGGNTFNNRTTDLSNYVQMLVRISATDALNGGGTINLQPFFQTNNFTSNQVLATQPLPIDGQFHDMVFAMPSTLLNMNVVDQTVLNLGSHTNELTINVDLIRFSMVPEPATMSLIGIALIGGLGLTCRVRRAV